MKKLSKEDVKRLQGLIENVRELELKLEDELSVVNIAVEKAKDVQSDYVEALNELNAFREDIVNEIDAYMDERGERWHDGDKGQAYADWKNQWEEAENDLDFDEDQLEEIVLEFSGFADTMEQLPQEVE